MAITRPLRKRKEDDEDVNKFIGGAPDGAPRSDDAPEQESSPRRRKRGRPKGSASKIKKRQISLVLPTALIDDVDDLANEHGTTRVNVITAALRRFVNRDDLFV